MAWFRFEHHRQAVDSPASDVLAAALHFSPTVDRSHNPGDLFEAHDADDQDRTELAYQTSLRGGCGGHPETDIQLLDLE